MKTMDFCTAIEYNNYEGDVFMILEFSVENFLSFKEKVTFSMFANGTKGLDDNYVEFENKKILKTAAIYGANASGKSNVFKVLNLVILMIKQSNNIDVNSRLPITPFKFSSNNNLSSFEIKFIKNKIKYVYGFSANANEITDEYLYYYPNGRESKIFDRTNIHEYSFIQSETRELTDLAHKTSKNKFFLSTATNWNYQKTKPVYDFFTVDLNVCFTTEKLKDIAFDLYINDYNNKLKYFALDFLEKADFNIVDYDIKTIDIIKDFATGYNDLLHPKAYVTMFTHLIGEKKYKIDYIEESIGTQMIFILIPFFASAMENNKILVIDELDRSLHPFLVQHIVSMFNDSNINKNGAQLIFNTHDTNLLDLNILRRDQIWFAEKDSKTGSSDLYSLSDFSVRNNENIEKGYMLGRYGAVPFISTDINLWEEK